jgi:hypothetical protein
VLLSKFGTIFEGHPSTSLVYFNQALNIPFDKNENPADVLMDILSGKKNINACDLVNTWRSIGYHWVQQCYQAYPLLPCILDKSTLFDSNTREYAGTTLQEFDTATADDLHLYFKGIGLYVNNQQCGEMITKYGQNNTISKQSIIKHFHEVCSNAFCFDNYANIIERIDLLTRTPKNILHAHTEAQITKHIVIAYKFIRKLMRRIGKRHEQDNVQPPESITKDILLTSMTLKALHEYSNPTVDVIQDKLQLTDIDRKRSKPNFFTRVIHISLRKGLTVWRSLWQLQLIIPMIAAFIVGEIQGVDYEVGQYPGNIAYGTVTLAVLSTITHVKTFTNDRLLIRRETESKLGIFPYIFAYNIVDLLWITLIPFVFTIIYYNIILPNTPYVQFYTIALMVCWWCSGLSYFVSSFALPLHWATLIAVFITIIAGAFLQGLNPTIAQSMGTFQGFLVHLSFNRWAMESFTIKEYQYFDKTQPNIVWLTMDRIGLCGQNGSMTNSTSMDFDQYSEIFNRVQSNVTTECHKYVTDAYLWLFGYGCIYRVLSIIILLFTTHPILLRFQWKLYYVFMLQWI